MDDSGQDFTDDQKKRYRAVCPACDGPAMPRWLRIPDTDLPGINWTFTQKDCQTRGCQNYRP